MLNLNKIKVKDKTVLVRIDINSSIINKKVQCNDRFVEHTKTINYLLKNKAKLVILAHQGRKGKKDFTSLEQHAKILSRLLGKKIFYVNELFGKKALTAIKNLKSGQAILLQNVRQFDGETKNISSVEHAQTKFVKILAPLFDVFILDAFSVAHRSHASVVGFAKAIKKQGGKACSGFVLEQELKALKKFEAKLKKIIKKKPETLVYLLAGAKPEENLILFRKAVNQRATIITGGTFCLIYLIASGKKLGKSNELLKKHKDVIKKIKKIKAKNIFLPVDFAIELKKKRKEINLDALPSNKQLLDIGKKTIEIYKEKIKKAGIVVVKGPLGKYEDKRFALGTKKLYEAIALSKAYSVIGGGNTIDAMTRFKIKKNKFSYISLGGGALLEYLAGKRLPGIVALEN